MRIYKIGEKIDFYHDGDVLTGKVIKIHKTIFGNIEYCIEYVLASPNNYSNLHGGFRSSSLKNAWVKHKYISPPLNQTKDKQQKISG